MNLFVSFSQPGRVMALTGLRMMPTFPSPSLKFRTVGFPQYGFKDGISDGTFLQYGKVKPAPGIPSSECSLSPSFACAFYGGRPGSEPSSIRSSTCHHSRNIRSSTPGVLCSGASYVVSLPLRLYDPIRQSRRHAATSWHSPYTQRLRCAGAPRRPTRPSLLSLLLLSIRAIDLTTGGSAVPSRCTRTAISGFLDLRASRHPQRPSLPAISDGVSCFRGCIVRFMLRPVCLPSPPDWLRRGEVICSSPRLLRYIVTPAFDAARCQAALGVRLNGRTRNFPLLGLSPNQ